VAPGTLFAIFAGIYYWFPKVTGRTLNETLGRLHFWTSLVAMNMVFFPMFLQGLAGMNRRLYDGGRSYSFLSGFEGSFTHQAIGTILLGSAQLFFIGNLVWTLAKGRRAAENPWQATTIEWSTTSPPPHENFHATPTAHRGPYEYSVPGAGADFTPQTEAPQ
jgi:cytochrome c oxidase subunit 1